MNSARKRKWWLTILAPPESLSLIDDKWDSFSCRPHWRLLYSSDTLLEGWANYFGTPPCLTTFKVWIAGSRPPPQGGDIIQWLNSAAWRRHACHIPTLVLVTAILQNVQIKNPRTTEESLSCPMLEWGTILLLKKILSQVSREVSDQVILRPSYFKKRFNLSGRKAVKKAVWHEVKLHQKGIHPRMGISTLESGTSWACFLLNSWSSQSPKEYTRARFECLALSNKLCRHGIWRTHQIPFHSVVNPVPSLHVCSEYPWSINTMRLVSTSGSLRISRRCSAGRSGFFALNSMGARFGCLHSHKLYSTLSLPIMLYSLVTYWREPVVRTIQGLAISSLPAPPFAAMVLLLNGLFCSWPSNFRIRLLVA